jgi:hypothetical protein
MMNTHLKNIKEVRAYVEDARASADSGDYETAHDIEDMLYIALLTEIANGKCPDPKQYAKEALESQKLEFPRWCA